MSKDNDLSLYSNFTQIGGDYKNAKKEFIKREKKAQEYIDDETINEKKELDKAIEKYNDKMSSIVKSNKYKNFEKEALEYSKEMNHNLVKAKDSFFKIKKDILKRTEWDTDKKNKKIQELYDYILNKLYTKEEVEQFKKMINMIMVIPSNDK
jgi:hypothetical protein